VIYESDKDGNVRCIIRIKLDNDEVSVVWEVVRAAEGKILRVGCSNGTVCEL